MELPTGYRFRPTEEELINDFLIPRICGIKSKHIADVEFLKFDPWNLPAEASAIKSKKDQYWYFFYELGTKYKNSKRANRRTENGYWKITGKDRKVYSSDSREAIAIKKNLTFYIGRFPNGRITNWVIHEYHPTPPKFNVKNFVVCCLKKKNNEKAENSSPEDGQSNRYVPSNCASVSSDTSPEDNLFSLQNLTKYGWLEDDYDSQSQDQITIQQCQAFVPGSRPTYYADSSDQEILETRPSIWFDEPEESAQSEVDTLIEGLHNADNPLTTFLDMMSARTAPHQMGKDELQIGLDRAGDRTPEIFALTRLFHTNDDPQVVAMSAGPLFNNTSDRDAETPLELVRGTSKGYRQMLMVQGHHGTPPSSSRGSSSVDSHTNERISFMQHKEIPIHKLHSPSLSNKGEARMLELQGDFTRKAVISDKVGEAPKRRTAVKLSGKQKSKTGSSRDLKMPMDTLKSSSDEPAASGQKGLSAFHDASSPPLVYLGNALIGMVLLIVVVRELMLYGWY